MIITIARECGSGGREIGARLAKSLDIPLYDKKKLIEEAKKMGKFEENRGFFDEKPMNSFLYGIVTGYGFTNESVNENSFQLIREITKETDFVIIGRCSNVIYEEYEDVISVYIHADNEFRANRLMKINSCSQGRAYELMEEFDERRSKFHEYCTGQKWGEAKYYDLCINSSALGITGAIEQIKGFIINKRRNILELL